MRFLEVLEGIGESGILGVLVGSFLAARPSSQFNPTHVFFFFGM